MNEPDRLVFTPGAVLDLLSQIDELKHLDVGLTEAGDRGIQISIGDSVYNLLTDEAAEVHVDDEALGTVKDVNLDAFEGIDEPDLELDISEEMPEDDIEGGVFKQIAKTLLIGGMIRLTNSLLKK